MSVWKKINEYSGKLIEDIFRQDEKNSFLRWVFTLAIMVLIRVFLMVISQGLPDKSGGYILVLYFQDFFFFLIAFLLIWIWLALLLRVRPRELLGVLLWGSWLVVLPVVIDLVFAGKVYWSFYLLNDLKGLWTQYYSLFGHLPPAIIYFGARITIFVAVLATSGLVYLKTKNISKSVANLIVVYSIFFFMGSFPSWLSFLFFAFKGKSALMVSAPDVAGLIASPVNIFGIQYYSLTSALSYKLNIIYFVIAIVLGMIIAVLQDRGNKKSLILGWGWIYEGLFFVLGFLAGRILYAQNINLNLFSSFAIIVLLISLMVSRRADELLIISKKEKRESESGVLFLNVVALAGFLMIGVKFLLLALIYKALMYIYLDDAFNLWKVPLAEGIIRGCSLILGAFLGFMLLSDNQSLIGFPYWLVLWATVASLAVLYLKKEKKSLETSSDDKKEDIKRIVLASIIFLIFIFGAVIFQKEWLFWWALILGGTSFWLIEKKISRKAEIIAVFFILYLCSLVLFG